MTYPTLATTRAVRLKDGRVRLSGCSIANVECFEEGDEERFGNRLVEALLRREPTIKKIVISFDDGDELQINIETATDADPASGI